MPSTDIWRMNRSFRSLWFAGTISALGDYAFLGALGVWVALLTGSPSKVGLVIAAETAGSLALGAAAGAWVDRWPKRRVMIAMDLTRAALLPLLLLVARPGRFWLLLSIAFALAACGRFFSPARSAMLREVVAPDDLAAANGLQQSAYSAALMIGPAVGVWLMAELGPAPVILGDALSFLLSAYFLRQLPAVLPGKTVVGERTWSRFLSGWRGVRCHPTVRRLFIVTALVMAGGGALNALDAFFILRCLHLPARYIGIFNGVFVLGLLGGGAVAANRRARRLPSWHLAGWGILSMGGFIIAYAFSPHAGAAIPFLICAGLGNGLINAALPAILLGAVDQDRIGTVTGLFETCISATTLLSTLLAGTLAEWISLRGILGAAGAIIAAAGLAMLLAKAEGKDAISPKRYPGEMI